jgi:hypothetical protein
VFVSFFKFASVSFLFLSFNLLSCDVIDVMTNKVGSNVGIAKNDIIFSGGVAVFSIQEIGYDYQHSLAVIQGKDDVRDFATYSQGLCAIVGGECKSVEVDGSSVLQIDGDGMRTLSLPVFNGGVLVGQIQRTQSITSEKMECMRSDNAYIKKSMEIFINTGQKQSVLDYLKSIKKITE